MLLLDSCGPMFSDSTGDIARWGAVITIPQIRKLKLRTKRWLKCVSTPCLSDSTTHGLFTNRRTFSGQRRGQRFPDRRCKTFTLFSIWKKHAFLFCWAAFLLAVRQPCSLKGKTSTSFSKERPSKARLALTVQFRCCVSPWPAVCRAHYGTVLFLHWRCYWRLQHGLWQMGIPIKFFSRVGHSINHWHYPNPSETLGHFFSYEQKVKGKKQRIYSNYFSYFFLLHALG